MQPCSEPKQSRTGLVLCGSPNNFTSMEIATATVEGDYQTVRLPKGIHFERPERGQLPPVRNL